jgi:HK97 gp10 family phage protein
MASLGKILDVMTQVKRIEKQLNSVAAKCEVPVEETILTQASLVAAEIKSLAPVSNDDHPGELRDSIRVERGSPTAKKSLVVKIKGGGKLTRRGVVEGKAGVGYDYDYARAVEFGTEKMPAHPFFFPIWRARRKEVRAAIRKKIQLAVRDVFK